VFVGSGGIAVANELVAASPFGDWAMLGIFLLISFIAGFFLAFLPTGRDGSGVAWASALSVATVTVLAWPEERHRTLVHVALAVLAALWLWRRVAPAWASPRGRQRELAASAWFVLGCLVVVVIGAVGHVQDLARDDEIVRAIAYPWTVVAGTAVALGFGYVLGRPRPAHAPLGGTPAPLE